MTQDKTQGPFWGTGDLDDDGSSITQISCRLNPILTPNLVQPALIRARKHKFLAGEPAEVGGPLGCLGRNPREGSFRLGPSSSHFPVNKALGRKCVWPRRTPNCRSRVSCAHTRVLRKG